jgi:hypothetical protein
MNPRTIIWRSESIPGREKLLLKEVNKNNIMAISHVTGGDADLNTVWDARYTITCDESWRVRDVTIKEIISGHQLKMHSDGLGYWTNENGEEIENVRGCIDIDFRATPFSNTFPIRRLHLAVGESSAIEVVYINAPDLKITKEHQIYTRLNDHEWKFEQPSADFEAVVTIDSDGLVVSYPGLFIRADN